MCSVSSLFSNLLDILMRNDLHIVICELEPSEVQLSAFNYLELSEIRMVSNVT